MKLPGLLSLLLVVGCGPVGDVADEQVVAASLQDLDTNMLVILAGPVGGDALLVWETPEGTGGALPVSVQGGALGLVFAMGIDLQPGSDVPLDLSEADEDLTVRDLMGTYRGTSWNAAAMIGGAGHKLKNRQDVVLEDEHLTVGIGIEAGFEWLRIREGGEETLDTGDDEPIDTDFPEDTDVEDTDPVDTDVPDFPDDTGGDGAGSGCDGDGCGGDSSGGCDDGGLCGCSSGGRSSMPLVFVSVLALFRRRSPASPGTPAARPGWRAAERPGRAGI